MSVGATGDFRVWPDADIQKASIDVCVRGISRHSIWDASFPLMTDAVEKVQNEQTEFFPCAHVETGLRYSNSA